MHVDIAHEITLPASLKLGDQVIPIRDQDGKVITLEEKWLLQEGREGEIVEHATLTQQIQQQLIDFWKPRWWKDTLPQLAERDRTCQLCQSISALRTFGTCGYFYRSMG